MKEWSVPVKVNGKITGYAKTKKDAESNAKIMLSHKKTVSKKK